jgi:uncharacterized membrane protein
VFSDRFIFFGILHFIAAALILTRLMLPLGRANLLVGLAVCVVGLVFKDDFFNARETAWIAMGTHKPLTEDYVPILPWLGVTLVGAALGAFWERRSFAVHRWLAGPNASPPRWLVFLGSWSLTIYLVHQPVLFGTLWLVKKAIG